ncbi:F0F1 ATP synthase subunit A [Cellulomonas marina]|nr:F0F1 ATP synthase subunit A [Cellulomonas marina]
MSSTATAALTLAAEEGGGFHAPTLADFFPGAIAFDGTFVEFNRIMMVRVIATVLLLTIMVLAARRATLVPGRGQNVVEVLLDFVRVNVAEEILGKKEARRYVPLLTAVFFAILAFNITGVIPGLNIAGTSVIGLPIVFALIMYVVYLHAGIQRQGLGGFLKTNLFPAGVPAPMYVLLTPIEFLTVFVLRPATLAIRLVANMIAGHLMLVLCFAATNYFILEAAPALKAFGAVTFVAGLAITLFEVFIAALQAYIFVVLSAVYINLSIETEH